MPHIKVHTKIRLSPDIKVHTKIRLSPDIKREMEVVYRTGDEFIQITEYTRRLKGRKRGYMRGVQSKSLQNPLAVKVLVAPAGIKCAY